jgi:hypothetical protein
MISIGIAGLSIGIDERFDYIRALTENTERTTLVTLRFAPPMRILPRNARVAIWSTRTVILKAYPYTAI